MGFNEAGRYCKTCGRQVLARQQTPNHILHFLIAFFTCGLWVIPWFFLSQGNPWLCTVCGGQVGSATGAQPEARAATPQELARMRESSARARKVLVALSGAVFVIVVATAAIAVYMQRKTDKENELARERGRAAAAAAPATSPTPAPVVTTLTPATGMSADSIRVLRQDVKWDDGARAFIFRRYLRDAGQRCDEVTGQVMGDPGHWTVRCGAGYMFRFVFDAKGEMTSAVRLP